MVDLEEATKEYSLNLLKVTDWQTWPGERIVSILCLPQQGQALCSVLWRFGVIGHVLFVTIGFGTQRIRLRSRGRASISISGN